MSDKLQVVFNSPQCGWMSFELRAGEQSLTDAVCYTPYDPLSDLIRALSNLLQSDTELTVKWAYNPDEIDFNFKTRGDEAELEVKWYKNHLRIEGTGESEFFWRGSKLDLCYPFWNAINGIQRDMEVDEFTRNWRREFPEAEMKQLTEDIRAYQQKQGRTV